MSISFTKIRLPEITGGAHVALIATVYVFIGVNATPGVAFTPAKTYTVATSATWAPPVISGNRIFVKDAETLALWTLN